MKTVNIHEAKTHLSRLIDAAVKGEAFVIAKAGKPLVKVTAIGMDEVGRSGVAAEAARTVKRLQCVQKRNQVGFLVSCEADREAPIIELHDIAERRRGAVMEIRRARCQAA